MDLGIGAVGAYEMFGTINPWNEDLVLPQDSGSLPNARYLVALMHEPVKSEGDVFAFTVRVYDTQPFYFQIWRPTGNVNEFQLIASRQVTPSVSREEHENVRLTTLRAFD